MDVENRLRKGFKEGRAEQTHEPRKTHQRDVARANLGHERVFERLARGIVAMTDGHRLDPRGARASESRCVAAVRDHYGDLGAQPSVRDRVDQRLQIAAASGDQHCDAASGVRPHTLTLRRQSPGS